MRKLSTGWTAILLLIVFFFAGCDDEDSPTVPVIGTVTDIVAQDSRFSTLAAALERTGLDATLDIFSASYTVFAPTDAAFQASGIDLNAVSDDALAGVLQYHVIGNSIRAADIPDGTTALGTVNAAGPGGANLPIFVTNSNGSVSINDNVMVTETDIEAVNGVIHVIDNVLLPPSILDRARLDGRFTTLVTALERTGLDAAVNAAGDFTVFAPTDDAFTDAGIVLNDVSDEDLSALLLYHVIGTALPAGNIPAGDNFVTTLNTTGPGDTGLSALVNNTSGAVTVNADATVVVADVFATNGVIHAVNKVLGTQTIVDFAVKAEGTSSLEDALAAANLVDALSVEGPLTVFAPVNSAFDAVADAVAGFMGDQLAKTLTFHVANGNVRSTDLSSTDVPTLNGEDSIEIRLDPGADAGSPDDDFFFIRTSDSTSVNFILTDIQGTNGVIHLIDGVLLPDNL